MSKILTFKGTGGGRGGGSNRGGGRGPGRMGGTAAGPGGDCVCPACGYKESHVAGQPCSRKKCPTCKTTMIRE